MSQYDFSDSGEASDTATTGAIADLSASALSSFTASDFATATSCLRSLRSLQTSPALLPRVLYNQAVVNFYTSTSPSNAQSLLTKTLSALPSQASVPSPVTPKTALAFLARSDVTPAAFTALGFVPLFNAAVVAYNSGELNHASTLATVLFSHVESVEEDWLAIRTCFLAADIHLRTHSLSTVSKILTYLETLTPSPLPSPCPTSWSLPALSVMTLPTTPSDLTCTLHLYTARLAAASADARLLKKESKSAVVAANPDGPTPTAAALLVKAQLDASASKALRVMESIHAQSPPRVRAAVRPLLLNNIGVIHARLGRHALAATYLTRSRHAFGELFSAREGTALSIIARARETHTAYNLALSHLRLGNFRHALALFTDCARADEVLSASSPALWIRIAECCIAQAGEASKLEPVATLCGTGPRRRYVLSTLKPPNMALMHYASTCARAALAIISQPQSVADANADDDTSAAAAAAANRHRCAALALLSFATLHFDPGASIVACDELVACSRPGDSDHAVLGRLYGAEALCLLGRPDEAAERLTPLLAMSGASFADGREGAFVNAALAHTLRGDMAAAVRAAKAALKVTALCAPRASPRRNAIAVAAYVSLRDGNSEAARQILSTTR